MTLDPQAHGGRTGLASGCPDRGENMPVPADRSTRTPRNQRCPLRYLALFKPFDVLCQFTDADGRATLKDHLTVPGVYPVGRLDRDSEGLLLLTDDGPLAHRLTDPRFEHPRTYLVQVERVPGPAALVALRRGIVLADGPTRPAEIELLESAPSLPTVRCQSASANSCPPPGSG